MQKIKQDLPQKGPNQKTKKVKEGMPKNIEEKIEDF